MKRNGITGTAFMILFACSMLVGCSSQNKQKETHLIKPPITEINGRPVIYIPCVVNPPYRPYNQKTHPIFVDECTWKQVSNE